MSQYNQQNQATTLEIATEAPSYVAPPPPPPPGYPTNDNIGFSAPIQTMSRGDGECSCMECLKCLFCLNSCYSLIKCCCEISASA